MRAVKLVVLVVACASLSARAADGTGSAHSLAAAERGFSNAMVERNFEAFSSHIAADAVFINGGKPLRGKKAILEHWKRFFEAKEAPFQWEPEIAEVSEPEALGYTEGPVSLMSGTPIARFNSTWRRDKHGKWEVIFDNGHDLCSCKP